MAHERVLVVDDEPQVAASVEDLLEDDFEVVTFTKPGRALDFMTKEGDIAVIISDQRMPELSGDKLLSEAKELSEATRVLMTGYADLDSVVRAVNHGQIYGYLSKPWDPLDLKVLVMRAAEHYRLMRRLAGERELLHSLMDNIPDTIYYKDTQLRFTRINEAYARFFNLERPEDAVGKTILDFTDQERAQNISQEEQHLLSSGELTVNKIEQISSPDDRRLWVSTTKVPIKNTQGLITGLVGISRDITDHKQLMVDLEEARRMQRHLSHHDALTNLPNQQLFSDRLQHALEMAKRYDYKVAVLLLNLNRFKFINDSYGHATGDRLLTQVASRIKECLRDSDSVSRLGADEFTIMVEQLTQIQDATKIAKKILRKLAKPYTLNGTDLTATFSVGISLYPNDAADIQALVSTAGRAMRRAKAERVNGYRFYAPSMDANELQALELEKTLCNAIGNDELVLFYQPQVSIATHEITGVEALIRWQHPALGLLPPPKFISLAEETGLIVTIGEWVLRTACKQAKTWQDAGYEGIRMGVNLSPRQFRVMNLEESIKAVVRDTGMDLRNLVLEITESNAMQDIDFSIMTLNMLREIGVHIAIDDFGTGYASLNHLKRLPLDILKVDRSFVNELDKHEEDQAIVAAIVAMAQTLNMKVLAEGVENIDQIDFLGSLQCDEMQGYYFSRPVAADTITEILKCGSRLPLNHELATTY